MCKARTSLFVASALVLAAGILAAAPPKGADGKVGTNPVIRARHIEGMVVKNSDGQDL